MFATKIGFNDRADGFILTRRLWIQSSRRPTTGTLSLMYPNDTFRMRYPAEWAKVYGEPRLPFEFHIGLYCATLAIGRSTGLYDILQEAMGPKNGNAVMDYAMFLLRSRSNTTQLFAETMRTQALFSERAYEGEIYKSLPV